MKLCVCDPDATFRHYNSVDSIHITDKLWERDKMHYPFFDRSKEIVIDIHPGEDFEQKIEEFSEFENYCIAIPWKDREYTKILNEHNIPWMFSTYCSTKDMFLAQLYYGEKQPSQITIVEGLAFYLKDITNLLGFPNNRETKIRVIANIGQSSKGTNKTPQQITKFFIRPEDLKHYERYVDTVELVGPPDKLSVIYEIYQRREWKGPINMIIQDLDLDIVNSTLPPNFGDERINCGQRCAFRKCNLCYRSYWLGVKLEEAGIEIAEEKDKILWEWKPL